MDLGISTLTDDQLVELLQEACAELAQRDPIVRQLSQQKIDRRAEQLKVEREVARQNILSADHQATLMIEAVKAAYRRLRDEQAKELFDLVYREVRSEYDAGELRPFTPEEESKLFIQAEMQARESIQKQRRNPSSHKPMNPYADGVNGAIRQDSPADNTVVDRAMNRSYYNDKF